MRRRAGSIAVTLHDVEPATYERCALIRDWLCDHGIDRATLLVIPAPDLHAFNDRRPELAGWLDERLRAGDAVAQHGLQHRRATQQPVSHRFVRHLQGGPGAEFVGLDGDETRRAVLAGRRVLRLAGIQPRGFVAPAYAYTPALHATLASMFAWWAGLTQLHVAGGAAMTAPALSLATASRVQRWVTPALVRGGALASGDLLRLELHPSDLDHPRCVRAIERVLRTASGRTAVTYDELAGFGGQAS